MGTLRPARPTGAPATLLAYLWAGPNTLLGLLLLPLVLATRGRCALRAGVVELHGGVLGPLLRHAVPLRGGVAALTLGHVVVARDRAALDATRSHERVHVAQYERWGPFFLPAYFLASLLAAARGQGAYSGNPFERQARKLEHP